ncbi:hypothetical protein [Herbaspirillum rubrisubalbicans]|jgi:hypothetical protein|uniref:hypothetical protein n=1 Tax=Herbaspirillum rubrisubalbicans TaxID=80842 RepID=UPI000DD43684|nr:hypothetical protein [Herbaspirillum rubrisubalbicans]MCP1575790.1 hypothetical protein [Herbaspirillum rubrisubalbicans]
MFDFMTDEIPDEDRVPYKVIRLWLLSLYHTYCRSKILSIERRGFTWGENEDELAYAYEEMEGALRRPIENLMLEILALILMAGCGSTLFYKYHCAEIKRILSENDFSELNSLLPEGEKEEFAFDLILLKRDTNVDEEIKALIQYDGRKIMIGSFEVKW